MKKANKENKLIKVEAITPSEIVIDLKPPEKIEGAIKYSPEVAIDIFDLICNKGLSRARAANRVGLSHNMVYNWTKKSPEFEMFILMAEAKLQERLLGLLSKWMTGEQKTATWQAIMTFLERRFPKEFAQPPRIQQITGEGGGAVKIIIQGSPPRPPKVHPTREALTEAKK